MKIWAGCGRELHCFSTHLLLRGRNFLPILRDLLLSGGKLLLILRDLRSQGRKLASQR